MMEFALRKQGLYDADLEGRTRTNYCVQTSKVTKDSFDFQIVAVPVENGNYKKIYQMFSELGQHTLCNL